MDTASIIAELEAESNRLTLAINALRGISRTPAKRGRHHLTAAAKKRISDKMKQRWAIRKAAKTHPPTTTTNGTSVSTLIREAIGTGKLPIDKIVKQVQPKTNKSAKKIMDNVYAMKGSGYLNKNQHGMYSLARPN